MNGPDHYRQAERLTDDAQSAANAGHNGSATVYLAAAQVHATLALVAATALANRSQMSRDDGHEWRAVAGTRNRETS